MKVILVGTLLLAISLTYVLMNTNSHPTISGVNKNGFFKPDRQFLKIVSVKPIDPDKLPKDLSGIPVILLNSSIYITPNYMTLKNINSGGDYILPACYLFDKDYLKVITWGPSRKILGETFELEVVGEKLNLKYGKWFNLTLKPIEKPSNFNHRIKQLDATYNRIFDRNQLVHNNCNLKKIDLNLKNPKNINMHFKESNKTNALLDPSTSITQSSSRSAKPIDISKKEIIIDGCKAEKQNMIAMSKRRHPNLKKVGKFKNGFYIFQGFYGKDNQSKYCNRVTTIKEIAYEPLITEYNIDLGQYNNDKLSYKNWYSYNSIIVSNSKVKLLLSELDSDTIQVEKITE